MHGQYFDILFESVHAGIIGTIFFFLFIRGKSLFFHQKKGWNFILTGFGLLFFGTLLDITDNFTPLNRFAILGDTKYEAFLEKLVGYTLGSLLLAIGFWRFLPAIFELRESERLLRIKEESLQTSRDRLDFILTRSPAVIYTCRPGVDFRATFVSENVKDLIGYEPHEFIDDSRFWLSCIHPDDVQRVCANLDRLSESDTYSIEYRFLTRDGGYIWLHDRMRLVRNPDGIPVELIGYWSDVSARKMAEEREEELKRDLERRVAERTAELDELNRELKALNFTLSHEMRAPLLRIKGFAKILIESGTPKLSDEEMHCLSRIKAATELLDEQTEALLKLYEIDCHELYMEPVNLSELAAFIISGLQQLEPERRVAITITEGIVATADKILVKELMTNLLANAWKHTAAREDAWIGFNVAADADGPVYCISDNGPEIDVAQIDKMFTPFFRLHRDDSSAGVGLASVHRIVRLHGGQIWVESSKEEGTSFHFTLQWSVRAKQGQPLHMENVCRPNQAFLDTDRS